MTKIRILIVDDDGTLSVLNDRLNATSFFEAETEIYGVEAVDHALRFRPDIIIVDYQLDKDRKDGGILTDGNVVIEDLKRDADLQHVPVVRCSRWFTDTENRLFEEENVHRSVFAIKCTVGGETELLAKIAHVFFTLSRK